MREFLIKYFLIRLKRNSNTVLSNTWKLARKIGVWQKSPYAWFWKLNVNWKIRKNKLFRQFLLRAHYCPAFYIGDWSHWTVPNNSQILLMKALFVVVVAFIICCTGKRVLRSSRIILLSVVTSDLNSKNGDSWDQLINFKSSSDPVFNVNDRGYFSLWRLKCRNIHSEKTDNCHNLLHHIYSHIANSLVQITMFIP